MSDDDIKEKLTHTLDVFDLLSDKDYFEEHYRSLMATRLLDGSCANDEFEDLVKKLLLLKNGQSFISKINGMQVDVSSGSAMVPACKAYFESKEITVDFDMKLLTESFWPSFTKDIDNIRLPLELQRCTQAYEEFFTSANQSKRLRWTLVNGQVTLNGSFGKSKYTIKANILQTTVLCLFNCFGALSFDQIKQETGIPENFLKVVLHSLYVGKFQVLAKSDDQKRIRTTDVFQPNVGFTSKSNRFEIKMAVVEERSQGPRVDGTTSRHPVLEAVIVRLMKARHKLTINDVTAEVLKQVNLFKPTARDIKQRIECLIEREYLERDASDKNILNYLA